MPKSILIDLNVILDVLLERRGFETSRDVIRLTENNSHKLYVSAHSVTTFAYLLENKRVPKSEILRQVNWLLHTFNIVPVGSELLLKATESHVSDYEDAVVERAGVICQAKFIVTRNIKDFKTSVIPALTPEVFLQTLS